MSSVAVELADGRVRLSDPKPAYCTACFRGAEAGVRFVDMGAAYDSGAFQNRETLAYVDGSDDLHLCEACVKTAAEALGVKPEIHAKQMRAIRRLETERDHWKDATRDALKDRDSWKGRYEQLGEKT